MLELFIIMVVSLLFLFGLSYQKNRNLLSLIAHLKEELKKESEIRSRIELELQEKSNDLAHIKGSFEQILLQKEQSLKENRVFVETINQLKKELSDKSILHARLESDAESMKLRLTEHKESLNTVKEELKKEFKIISSDIFEHKQKQFSEASQQSIMSLLDPIQKTFKEFKHKIEATHLEDVASRAGLVEQLNQLQKLNQTISKETQNLTSALKGDNKLQGNWGEMILENLLTNSGLIEGQEYSREKSFDTDDGKRLRPDVIINLPDNKHVIIDSKVTLLDYERSLNATSAEEKKIAVKKHIQNLKKHIKSLADKRYDHLEKLNSADFILMFVPVEGAYLLAIEKEPSLFEQAFNQRIAVVTPTTLFTTLKTVEQLWRYERQSENTVKLIKRASEVHDKFVGFVESFEKVGKQLQTSMNTFEVAKKQMLSGSGNLVRQAEMLKELSGKTKKEIPPHLLKEAEGNKIE